MIGAWLTRRRLALGATAAVLMGGTALLSCSAISPQPVSSAVLGNQWQCSNFAFLTTCTRVEMITPVAHSLSRSPQGRPGV